VHSLDYLLKPIHPDRLAMSIGRLTARAQAAAIPSEEADFVTLKEDRMLRKVPSNSITHITAADNYSSVHLTDGAPAFVRRSLAEWEKILSPEKFVRVERSLIVRIDAILSLRAATRDCTELRIAGKAEPILLGRRAALILRRAMEKL
jgi:two-component system LytT family response regulator